MDDRSYRGGCPPYCTCVKCANKFNNKDKKRIYPKNYLYILIGLAVFIIFILILV